MTIPLLQAKIVLELTYQAPPSLSAGAEGTKVGDGGGIAQR